MRLLHHQSSHRAFSLAELLAVLAIVAALIGITTQMSRYLSSRRLESAAAAVENSLLMAKETAILKRVPVLLVIPTTGENAFRGLALFEQSPNETGWKPITAWQAFPPSIVFDAQWSESPFQNQAPLPASFPSRAQMGAQQVAATNLCGILFDATGRSLHYPILEMRLRQERGGGSGPAYVDLRIPSMMREVEVKYP